MDTVSEKDMASSLESCVMLMVLCKALEVKCAMDLGSGFSSYVLRRYKRDYEPEMTVYSIDTDGFWLDMSRGFCEQHGLDMQGFMLWEEREKISQKCGLIFLDIQDYPSRQEYLPEVAEHYCHPGTAVLLDDMQWPRYSAAVYEKLAGLDYAHLNLHDETLDGFGRFAKLVLRFQLLIRGTRTIITRNASGSAETYSLGAEELKRWK